MIEDERRSRAARVVESARLMMNAARTAPKTKGNDLVEIALVSGDDLKVLSDHMKRIGTEENRPGMVRNSDNILRGDALLLIGCRPQPMGLNCSHCGYLNCAAKPVGVACVFNPMDVGIALGSACALAADLRLDTRIMYTAGIVAQQLGWLPGCCYVQAVAISATSKSPFFDRG
ncbi:MAG: ferredoxin [Muribaculaceae bacterium]|nr:ferredoxin [Muribaculaceae bacterium]